MKTFDIRTTARDQMIDITGEISGHLAASGVQDGSVTVWVPHTTAGVTINENADPDVVHDMLKALNRAVPWQQDFYRHSEGNSSAHVKSSLMGCGLTVPVSGGQMVLGTWQGIYFCEFDGPRDRHFLVRVTRQGGGGITDFKLQIAD